MPRYVLLRHELPADVDRVSHWDFMLEYEGVLWTWALEHLPASWRDHLGLDREDASDEVSAKRLADHRLEYLIYEGPISEGRGTVTRVAEGEYDLLRRQESSIEVELRGTLTGQITLAHRPDREDYFVRASTV